ncbi:MAG TPA: hypothetical protein VFE46_06915 [Pirellulales bacterium]|jgi:hypothetical protein|nr:hypothetical protein [Pirellulales bacterium]
MAAALGALLIGQGALASSASAQVALEDEFGREPTWKAPTETEVRNQVLAWLKESRANESLRKQAGALWPAGPASEATKTGEAVSPVPQILQRVVATLALVDPNAKQLADICSQSSSNGKPPQFSWLVDEKMPTFVRNNLRLWLGQWLTQERFYDEGFEQLKGLQPTDVVDPAALLFYQSVCNHWMLHKDEGLKTIAQLLEQRKTIPRRYAEVAELMQADLSGLENESLDHISRRMNDVTRRLDFGNAGKKVRGEEDGIIDSLDKLIKELEDMANNMNSSNSNGREQGQEQDQPGQPGEQGNPQGIRSRNPASDSRLARGQGPGEVKNKNIGNHSGWGDLPPKEREEAMQQISKDFPSHYRDVIEQYFRKLASEDEDQNQK